MSYLDLTIKEINKALKEGKTTPEYLYNEAIERAKKYQNDYNAFVTILDNYDVNQKYDYSSPLAGIPVAVKDNFSTKGVLTTASSNILNNYVPVFDAAVIEKLKSAGCNIIGKTVLDELAMGGTGTTGHTGVVYNPYDRTRQSGGSSAGSAVAVALGIVPFALGSDTGDSVRKPASLCGIVGFKPSWGRISRFGLFPFAPSLDHVAYFTRSVEDCALILDVLAGEDERDSTCSYKPVENYSASLTKDVKGKKVAVIKEVIDSIKDKTVLENFKKCVDAYRNMGVMVEHVSMDENLLKAIYPAYMVISCCEATSNNANLDGIKFGNRMDGKNIDELMTNTRTNGFSTLIKRRFVIGSYSLAKAHQDDTFIRAQKVRRLIVNKVNDILKEYDAILLPASGDVAQKFDATSDKISSNYLIAENHLAIANFAGLPSITIPMGKKDGLPLGVNVTGRLFDEQNTLNLAYALESELGYKNMMAGGNK